MSVAASSVVSLRQLKVEQRKLRDEYMHLYLEKVFEKRLSSYPDLFEYLVRVIHKINSGRVSLEDLKQLGGILTDWDAKNAIFMSASTQQKMHEMYPYFDELSRKPDEELQKLIDHEENLYQIKKKLLNFNIELKNDLGVYTLDTFSAVTGTKSPTSQSDVVKISQGRKFQI